MNILNTIILALVQGITEYLPVSSTAHLIVVQKLLNVEVSVLFTVVLQLGTIFSSIYFFRHKIISIIKNTFSNVKTGNYKNDLGIWIIIGIIPVLIAGFLAGDLIDKIYAQPIIIVFTTIVFGFVFYIVELYYKKAKELKTIDQLNLKNIILVGFAQIVSIIPGVSRSGSTISGGLIQKIDFKDSIEVSFLMGIPVMLAAGLYELLKNIKSFTPDLALNLIIGVIVAYLAGLVSIKLTLSFLKKNGFLPFLIYRILFGIIVFIVLIK